MLELGLTSKRFTVEDAAAAGKLFHEWGWTDEPTGILDPFVAEIRANMRGN